MANDRPGASIPRNLVYCVYGSDLFFVEAKFSILSALGFLAREPGDVRITVCTTRPEEFAGWPVVPVPITDRQIAAWRGPSDHAYRFKIEVLREQMARDSATTLMVDSDTLFRASPRAVFDRIGPGRAVLHQDEGPVFGRPAHAELARLLAEA